MRKKMSTIIGLAIATILIAYISALTLSNQAFAQHSGPTVVQAGKVLAGQGTTSPVIIPWHSIQTDLPDHTKQYGFVNPPNGIIIKRDLGCSPWDPRGC